MADHRWSLVLALLAAAISAVIGFSLEPSASVELKGGNTLDVGPFLTFALILIASLLVASIIGEALERQRPRETLKKLLDRNDRYLFALRGVALVVVIMPLVLLAIDGVGGTGLLAAIWGPVELRLGPTGASALAQITATVYGLFLAVGAIDLFMAPLQSATLKAHQVAQGTRQFIATANSHVKEFLVEVERLVGGSQLPSSGDDAFGTYRSLTIKLHKIGSLDSALALLPLPFEDGQKLKGDLSRVVAGGEEIVQGLDFLRQYDPPNTRGGIKLASPLINGQIDAVKALDQMHRALESLHIDAKLTGGDPEVVRRKDMIVKSWSAFRGRVQNYYARSIAVAAAANGK